MQYNITDFRDHHTDRVKITALLKAAQRGIDAGKQDVIQLIEVAIGRLSEDGGGEADPSAVLPALPSPQPGLAPWQERALRRHIPLGLKGSLQVGDLARLTRLSKSHFSRAFRRSFGHSPAAYVRTARVEASKSDMIGSDESLAQIAVAYGFSDQAHFSRVFRAEVGMSPAAWRRRHATR